MAGGGMAFLAIGWLFLMLLSRSEAAIGDDCSANGDSDCNSGNNEVCNTVGGNVCACNTGYTNNSGTCDPVDCGAAPGAPTNGAAGTPTQGTTFGSTVTYTCNSGYTVTGSATINCQADGTWETAPTCTIVDCGTAPSAPTNGAAGTPTSGTTYGSSITFTCDAGYVVAGSATINCQAGGSWETAPTCTPGCGTVPAAPTNGAFDSSTGTANGDTATYTCDAGYQLAGGASGTINCQSATWETVPTCEAGSGGRSHLNDKHIWITVGLGFLCYGKLLQLVV